MDIAQALAYGQSHLASSESPRVDTERFLQHVLEKPRAYLFTWPDKILSPNQEQQFKDAIARRCTGEPVAYIVGTTDFWSLTLSVSPSTLIPRPDTELLVEQVLARFHSSASLNVLDLGTGTGAIALSLAKEQASWQVTGVDKVPDAVALAEQNAKQNLVTNARFLTGSWFEPVVGQFDLIVSNPPYIDKEDHHLNQGDVRFEPASALVSDGQGMADIEFIAQSARAYLAAGGWLYFEHGYDQGAAVRAVFDELGYQWAETVKDYGDNDRVTFAQWLGE